MQINLTLIEEEKPFLVAGFSELTKGWVFGFPYYHKTKSKDGISKVCPCILLPCADDGVGLPDESEFDFALRRGEFHPIRGKLYKFIKEEDGVYYFENGFFKQGIWFEI